MIKNRITAGLMIFVLFISTVINSSCVYAGTNNITDIKSSITKGAKDAASKVSKGTSAASSKMSEIGKEAEKKTSEAKKTATEMTSEVIDKTKDDINNAASVASKAKDEATKATDTATKYVGEKAGQAADGAKNVANSVNNTIKSIDLSKFKNGWDYAAKLYSSRVRTTKSTEYVAQVQKSIDKLEQDILKNHNTNRPNSSEGGFVAETWHADTYNIDATARGSKNTATVLEGERSKLGSVDVKVSDGEKYGLKYYKSAEASVEAQTKPIIEYYMEYKDKEIKAGNEPMEIEEFVQTKLDYDSNPDYYWSIYQEQVRLIPADQYDDAEKYLKKLIASEKSKAGKNRSAVAENYEDTLKNLQKRVESADGTKSIELTKAESEAIAQASKDGNFKPSDFGVTAAKVIKPSYIINQSIKAGSQAAIVNVAIVTGPEIYQIVKTLIENGDIDEEQLKKTGFDGLQAGSEGFLVGSVSNAILIACEAGKFGEQFKGASPDVVGALTVIALESAKYGYQMSKGQITAEQYADYMAEDIFITAASLGTGALVQMLLPMVPGAYFAGSMAGSMLGSMGYEAGKELALEIKNNGGMNVIVASAQTSGKEVKGKVCAAQTTITKALSNLDFKPPKDFSIKIYDLVSN